jgi:hypothetical protein
MRSRDDLGGRAPGHGRGRHDGIGGGDARFEHLLLLAPLLLGQLARVAALSLGAHAGLDELCAERLDLLLRSAAHVVRFDHGAEALRCGDGLKSRDAGADHEHLRWTDRAGGGRQHRQKLGQLIRRDEHRLVACDGRLRGQCIHRLRARDARHQLHGEARQLAVAHRFDFGGAPMRLHESDQDCAGGELSDLLECQRLHGQNHLRVRKHGSRSLAPFDALVGSIGELRALAGASLDEHARSGLSQLFGNLRYHADAGFLWRALTQRADGYGHERLLRLVLPVGRGQSATPSWKL